MRTQAHGRVKPMHISSLAQTATLLAILMPAFLMPDLMSAPATASAAGLEWHQEALVVEKPDELGYYTHVDADCPITRETVISTIDGVLIRSRISPIVDSYSDAEQLFIEINVYCAEMSNGSEVIFETDVRFGIVARNMDLVLNWDYGSLSHGNAADIDATVRRDVEDAITDYLKANMPVNQGGSGTRSRQEIEGTRL